MIGSLEAKIVQTNKGSARRKKLVATKRRITKKIDNQISDILHKLSSHLVSTLYNLGVQTVVIGDVRDIRTQSSMARRQTKNCTPGVLVNFDGYQYKAQKCGMEVKLQDEAYTSQTCTACKKRHKPTGRAYSCQCGFEFDRNGVGTYNIRTKYLGNFGSPVLGLMASPAGVRFVSHLQCRLNTAVSV
jgi:putative transposase